MPPPGTSLTNLYNINRNICALNASICLTAYLINQEILAAEIAKIQVMPEQASYLKTAFFGGTSGVLGLCTLLMGWYASLSEKRVNDVEQWFEKTMKECLPEPADQPLPSSQ